MVNSGANVVSQGDQGGAGAVTIDGCGIEVRGLVAALSRKDSAARVAIRSGRNLLVDGRDLAAASGTRTGMVRADAPTGTAVNKGVDLFARGNSSRDKGGSGIGLTIVRQVAFAHGGTARVEQGARGGARSHFFGSP